MVVECDHVWREISNYVDDDVDPALRAAMEEHFKECKHCTAILDGARNLVQLYGDDRMFEVPLGYGQRLHRRLAGNIGKSRRTFIGWMVATAAGIFIAGSYELARSATSTRDNLRSELAHFSAPVPPDLMVVVADDGKVFHGAAACPFIHDKTKVKSLLAREAVQQGYTPCVRCMKQYV